MYRLGKVSNFWHHKVDIPILVNYNTTVLVLGTPLIIKFIIWMCGVPV